MRKAISFFVLLLALSLCLKAQVYTGTDATRFASHADMVRMKNVSPIPDFIRFQSNSTLTENQISSWLSNEYKITSDFVIHQDKTEKDMDGRIIRYQQYFQGIPVFDAHFIAHEKNHRIVSLNGTLFNQLNIDNQAILQEHDALNFALNSFKADRYKWEMPAEEALLKRVTGNPEATYYPKGQLVLIPVEGNYENPVHRYAYQFDVYADKPVKRAYIYVDAQNGNVLKMIERIHNADVIGSAVTKYSGTRDITTDSFAESYRLREAGRGLGVETYNLQTGTDYGSAVDFTDADNTWNNVNSQMDEVATDAHWGAEMTYDYYFLKHNRNSIDDNGFKLMSYVHYDVQYANAFWDGQRMTYGDGDSQWTPLTALDICGHEITHGLTENTANLVYSYEQGALNEGYSDIFGTAIEFFGKPTMANWQMGENIGSAIRDLSNPKSFQLPNTYLGQYWYTGGGDNGGVHTNSGVICYWYYLACQGGQGTNDNGDAYNITGLGMEKASKIAYRALTTYLTPTSNYADARFYTIQAAMDLYGGCSNEVQVVTNAFYAVGVGPAFTPGVTAAFEESSNSFCFVPAQVTFTNGTSNGSSYIWDFGDGSTSTATNPTHAYTTAGTFTVSLFVDGGQCGSDTLVKQNLILVNPPVAPVTTSASNCGGPASLTLLANAPDSVKWFTTPTGGTSFYTGTTYVTPVLTQTTHYYVENQVASTPVYGGKTTNSGGGGYFNNSNQHYLEFTTYAPVIIKSVKVYAQGAGMRAIDLQDNNGNSLVTTNINIPNGESRIDLNFYVPVGTNFHLLGPPSPNLYRNNNGCSYPYNISGLLSITGSSATQNPTGYYYFFYDWEVESPSCISERVEVSAFISDSMPVAAFTHIDNGLTIGFTNTSVQGIDYTWDFGDGSAVSHVKNPSHTYALPGSYNVKLVVDNVCGSDSIAHEVNADLTGIQSIEGIHQLVCSPNPARQSVHITSTVANNQVTLRLMDLLGRVILTKSVKVSGNLLDEYLDLSSMNPGIYLLKVETGSDAKTVKLIIE